MRPSLPRVARALEACATLFGGSTPRVSPLEPIQSSATFTRKTIQRTCLLGVMARGKKSQERGLAKVRRKGKLQDSLVSALTQERYRAAVRLLLAFWKSNCFEPSCLQDMDEACAHFVEAAWSEGDSLTLALQALAGLQWLLPNVKGHLRHSWRLAKAWAKAEPPARARPFTSTMLMGLIGLALVLGRVDIAALFAIGFDGFLRSGELFNMKVKHVTFARGKAILQLPLTREDCGAGSWNALLLSLL